MISESWLINLYRRVYAKPKTVFVLKLAGNLAVAIVALIFAFVPLAFVLRGDYIATLKYVTMAAAPFVLVSMVRYLIDCKRPYEILDCPELVEIMENKKKGKSFPSRHVFSAFLIGVLSFSYSFALGLCCVLLGLFMAVERVVLGIHFIRDVATGAVIGILSGIIGLIIM